MPTKHSSNVQNSNVKALRGIVISYLPLSRDLKGFAWAWYILNDNDFEDSVL